MLDLPPITTNLAAPSDIWFGSRLASSSTSRRGSEPGRCDPPGSAGLLRTVKLHQIEGASGFQHLKADLEERAAIRSGGHAKAVLIRTLLFE